MAEDSSTTPGTPVVNKEPPKMVKRKTATPAEKKAADPAPVAKKEKAVKKAAVEKPVKAPKAPKVKLVVKPRTGVKIKETKFVIVASTEEGKKMWMRGGTVGLTDKVDVKGFKRVSEEDAKKNHLGKTRMIGHVSSQEELDEVPNKFFA